MSKHTAGPWSFDPNGGLPVIQIYCADNKNPFHGSRSDAEQVANAVLMASAPELLKALIQITDIYAEMRATLSQKYPQDGWSAETMTIDRARAAIAKALGEPRFPETFCSSCGKALGPGDAGVSSCKDHK